MYDKTCYGESICTLIPFTCYKYKQVNENLNAVYNCTIENQINNLRKCIKQTRKWQEHLKTDEIIMNRTKKKEID